MFLLYFISNCSLWVEMKNNLMLKVKIFQKLVRNYVKKRQKKYAPEDMVLAIREVMDKGKSISKVSKKYNVPYETLRGQISGDHGLHQGRPKQLNETEELDIA